MAAVLRPVRTPHMTGQKPAALAASLSAVRDTARRAVAALRGVRAAAERAQDPPK